ncbi:1-(5-phosphoribosyl)-5-[(5-phosphoribosylamino)methylideneamino]imidazole-4-carboxamide isomerase [Flintibacter muris]|uniref:1-(5-phosphoribosyl)-5-[(5- phosphoribosylamino)methylideneamino]imidazole-4- carboxamide isomerase n=1 Tax=Flintibacter muris TaxID=2941327 RepID=UPI00203B9158|nr:1-(5-phosphoribosyl)-5-[(5-phosphoribosylamino)methylideneamino]imidazole-4-carboxamide isomerase [Flintibacter muris]
MIIIPAIDLKDGKVVRLLKGDFNTVQQVADDPVTTAQAFYEAGARYLHVVDLDGSKDGVRKNSELVKAVTQVGLKTELGGGIRSMQDLEEVFALGVWRAIIGSAAVSDPDFVKAAVEKFGSERIAVGVDAKDGLVRTAGWVKEEGVNYLDFAKEMEALGVKNLIFTDIDTDGALTGPSFARLKFLLEGVGCSVTAAGGVSCNADIQSLVRMGVDAAIVGKAWYVGALDLKQAIEEAGPQ